MYDVILLEGVDRTGKSSLIQGILNTQGYYQVMHFEKPKKLDYYTEGNPLFMYQLESFENAMILANSGARIIYDRAHLGEYVYSRHRGYSGEYVFDLEKDHKIDQHPSLSLILLIEDFGISKHFNDDGKSLGPVDERELEQIMFIEAFFKSCIQDKKIVCVTAPDGSFRPKEDILKEALA
jgi:thymidylate kinase